MVAVGLAAFNLSMSVLTRSINALFMGPRLGPAELAALYGAATVSPICLLGNSSAEAALGAGLQGKEDRSCCRGLMAPGTQAEATEHTDFGAPIRQCRFFSSG